MSFDWMGYRARLDLERPELLWEDAADLSRLSLSSFFAELSPVRRDVSLGFLRLTGDGVDGHSAAVDDVAEVMRHFQRLVLASGLSLTGRTSLRGQLPGDIVSKTRLNLDGSAIPGSLVLQLVPAMLPRDEVLPSGQAEFLNDGEEQLVDAALARSIDLLNMSKDSGPNADDSEFVASLREAGPRVATTLRDFAGALVDANFETEVAWMQPRRKRLGSRMSTAELTHLGKLVESRELAREPVLLKGTLRTVSDIGPLKIDIGDGEIETVDAKHLPESDIKQLLVGMSVEIHASATEEVGAAGDSKTKYSATAIRLIR
ncbi:hypothetical protein H4V99_002635 [Cryobacterium sp. CG_9.6]|nr:hypothetical protein [Cryobacterium sp. CG_9.6]